MECKVRCYDYNEINENLLKQFSEGSSELEKLLIYCYTNKIETRACCIGHINDGQLSKPYICFVNCKNLYFIMENLIEFLLNQGEFSDNIEISITDQIISFKFDCLDANVREYFFGIIRNGLANIIERNFNVSEKYAGLFNMFNNMNVNNNLGLEISKKGLEINESRIGFFKTINDGNDIVEVEEKEADFAMDTCSTIKFVNDNEVANFIVEQNNNLRSFQTR